MWMLSRNCGSKLGFFLGYQHRKFRLKVIVIYHRFEDLPSLFSDTKYVLAFIKKINRKTAKILAPKLFEEPITIKNIPKTNIRFNTYEVGEFTEDNPKEVKQLELMKRVLDLKKLGFEEWQINEILKKYQ